MERSFRSVRLGVSAILLAIVAPFSCVPGASGPTPPEPPASGPGSAEIVAPEVRTTTVGTAGQEVFIYEPSGANLTSAPVIVFLHGYSGINPSVYGGWIRHLVQRGNIVLYPVYQDSLRHPEQYTSDALAAVQNAYDVLRGGDHILPDDTKLAIIGHSLGGVIAMNLAAVAHTSGLPRVLALMAANAGDTDAKAPSVPSIQTGNYDQIPAEMLFLGVVGEDDGIVGQDTVVSLYNDLTQIPSVNREVVELLSDHHGSPALRADHYTPLAIDQAFDSGQNLSTPWRDMALLSGRIPLGANSIDAFDYYGYWKWFDALTDAAFYGKNREYALGNTPQQTYLGTWSDGQPVVPAVRILPASDVSP